MIFTFVPAEEDRHPDEGVAPPRRVRGKHRGSAGSGFTRRRAVLQHSGGYQSGQMGQTVNLLSFDFGGSNPSLPTFLRLERSLVFCGSSSVDRALAFQAEGRGFEPRLPLFFFCCYSSVVEHFLGKEEVTSSSLVNSSLIT